MGVDLRPVDAYLLLLFALCFFPKKVCRNIDAGWKRVFDTEQEVPYAYKGDQWVGYDDSQSIGIKVGNSNFVLRERNVLFNDALNTFYLRLFGVRHTLRTILIVRKKTRCRHIGYSYRLTARVLLYAPSHRQDSTAHITAFVTPVVVFRLEVDIIRIKKEENVLFNDALDTFYLRLYGVRHMVKDHSDSERRNPLPLHGLLFPSSSKDVFICSIPQTG